MKTAMRTAMLTEQEKSGLIARSVGGNGIFERGNGGVREIYATACGKLEFVEFQDKTLGYVPSSLSCPAIYPLKETRFSSDAAGKAKAVLMDLDGTSVHSESFWMYIIERTIAALMDRADFQLAEEDEPFVSGHSVSEHLQYCIEKYYPSGSLERARTLYYQVTSYEMDEIMKGRGKQGAFTPAPYLREFLYTLQREKIKIGLVTSGLYNKAMPEIISAFRTLDMGDPLEFYDAIITAGQAIVKGQAGTLGELVPKPHPWLYSETARVGLGLSDQCRNAVIGLEDSSAGIYSLKLAGFASIGVAGGNIQRSGAKCLCNYFANGLEDALEIILGGRKNG